jgi:hypothetical protein
MAEATYLVCDFDNREAVETITFRIRNQNYLIDVCDKHLKEMTSRARKPRRGRPKTQGAK